HIGAYQVRTAKNQKITFIDTPGHEAFTAMRARGAKVTDIVVLVVAGDDGVMPQTKEAIAHAKAAGVPLIVAINKMDKPGSDASRVQNELLREEIQVEALGGDVQSIEVSATKRMNLDKLEEAILLQAEVLELKANPERPADGVVIEAKLDPGRGSVATVLVQRGTLKVGDVIVAGAVWGRVRRLVDDHAQPVESAGPAFPVEVLGLAGTPQAGDEFHVVESEARAREISDFRVRRDRQHELARVAGGRGTLEEMIKGIREGTAKELPVLIKADVQGSAEALAGALSRLGTEKVITRVVYSGVGGISEADMTLAKASGALIIGFNVRANPQAREIAKRDKVDIRYYSIIYKVTEDMQALMVGLLDPTYKETLVGNAQIREVFKVTKSGNVAGCMVTDGKVTRGNKVRLLRDNIVIHEGTLKSLRRFKDEVKEVQHGFECGMAFENYEDMKVGDVVECFDVEQVQATL
ncbi:MAG: translation initiation factor IF-2, partial [Rhodospirillales bacterium]|nr:translation initiation factor IF-2 [Rhodospirillales bacterium]